MAVEAIIAIINAVGTALTSKGARKALLGTYTDGTPRSLIDSLDGEYRSPAEKAKKKKKKGKGKKKGKKSKKPKSKYYF